MVHYRSVLALPLSLCAVWASHPASHETPAISRTFRRVQVDSPFVNSIPSLRLNDDSFLFIANAFVRLGVDMSRGGAIGWLSTVAEPSKNLLNNHDFGRLVQGVSLCSLLMCIT